MSSTDPTTTPQAQLSHVDREGRSAMVDVSAKATTQREAVAEALVTFPPAVYAQLAAGGFVGRKGSLVETARLAGLMAAKQTSSLIPLCHPLPLTYVDVQAEPRPAEHQLRLTCTARCTGPTGVEMEALTGVTVAALTLYDMAKALSHDIEITRVRLLRKTGGKSDVGIATQPASATAKLSDRVEG